MTPPRLPRLLVCGTNYGEHYVEAAALPPPRYRLVGLLARGSERSRRLARRHQVPLYTAVNELPPDLDLACCALPPETGDVVLELLARGTAVLCEHPQSSRLLNVALAAAVRHGTSFHLNAHFSDLPAPAAFVQICREQAGGRPPVFVEVTTTERLLYAALDTLARARVRLEPLEIRMTNRGPSCCQLAGCLADCEVSVHLQGVPAPGGGPPLPDGSPELVVDLRLAVYYADGVSSLLSIGGPALWNRSLNSSASATEPLWSGPQPERAFRAALQAERRAANRRAMDALIAATRTGAPLPQQEPQHLLTVSRAWEQILAALGSPGMQVASTFLPT